MDIESNSDNGILEDFIDLNMIGDSEAFRMVLKQVKKFAGCDAPILITGETGTGKEMAARAIHYLSVRRNFPFIPLNCGSIPENLLENELFGHEKGAYTDAKSSQRGIIGQADKGSLFLDEVDTFSPKGQVVLLRFLEDRIFRPLGSEHTEHADIRIIAATNADLAHDMSRKKFRQDLLYRLNVLSIELPPLSERSDDVLLLAEHFLSKYRNHYGQPNKYLHSESLKAMKRYSWPGNIRELENVIHREFLMSSGLCIRTEQIQSNAKDRRKNLLDRRQNLYLHHSFQTAKTLIVDQFEKRYLTRLIKISDGNITRAAKRSGKERSALGKLLKKHGITKESIL